MVILLASFGKALADPVAVTGADKVVFDEVTLDGSKSSESDPGLEIVLYEWLLIHSENSDFNRTKWGFDPVVTFSDLEPGFYSVILTVTNSAQVKNSAAMKLAAAGKWMVIPEIFSATPKSALPGELITLTGKDFGEPGDGSDVMQGKTALGIQSWSDTEIQFYFPADAYNCDWFGGETFKEKRVRVVVGEAESNKKKITINTPTCP
jgi:hypothetical protein